MTSEADVMREMILQAGTKISSYEVYVTSSVPIH